MNSSRQLFASSRVHLTDSIMTPTPNIAAEIKYGINIPPETKLQRVSVTNKSPGILIWKVVALVMGISFITVVVASSILLWHGLGSKCSTTSSSDEQSVNDTFRLIERNEWGAQPPTEVLTKLELPVPYVVISHTATDFCNTQSECTYRARFAQTFHIESRGWPDIGYNFLIGGDGNAYVGRSWDYVGAHTYGYNAKSIGISFIGTFNSVVPPQTQLLVAQRLIKSGVKAGKIAPDYKLLAHRQISSTLSPGDALFDVIKTWPHWSSTP